MLEGIEARKASEFLDLLNQNCEELLKAQSGSKPDCKQELMIEIDRIADEVMPIDAVLGQAYDSLAQIDDIQRRSEELLKYEKIIDVVWQQFDFKDNDYNRFEKEFSGKLRGSMNEASLRYVSRMIVKEIENVARNKEALRMMNSLVPGFLLKSQSIVDILDRIEDSQDRLKARRALRELEGVPTSERNNVVWIEQSRVLH